MVDPEHCGWRRTHSGSILVGILDAANLEWSRLGGVQAHGDLAHRVLEPLPKSVLWQVRRIIILSWCHS